jgi:hypothetical protein
LKLFIVFNLIIVRLLANSPQSCEFIGKLDSNTDLFKIYNKYNSNIVLVANNMYICSCGSRNLAGDMENRNLAGDMENRNLAGDMENRNLAGDMENRNLAGDMENRNLAGDMENRNLAGDMENRNLAGDTTQYTCSIVPTICNGYIFNNYNSKGLKYFDGQVIKEADNSCISW